MNLLSPDIYSRSSSHSRTLYSNRSQNSLRRRRVKDRKAPNRQSAVVDTSAAMQTDRQNERSVIIRVPDEITADKSWDKARSLSKTGAPTSPKIGSRLERAYQIYPETKEIKGAKTAGNSNSFSALEKSARVAVAQFYPLPHSVLRLNRKNAS